MDYQASLNRWLEKAADVLELHLSGGAKRIVCPSGTEPKLKLCLSVKGSSEEAAGRLLDALTTGANALVKERSGN